MYMLLNIPRAEVNVKSMLSAKIFPSCFVSLLLLKPSVGHNHLIDR